MREKQVRAIVCAALTAVVVCAGGAAAAEDVRAAVEAVNKQFSQAIAKGDAEGCAGLYTATARVLPPSAEPVEGREAILKLWQGFVASGLRDLALTTSEATASGDTAYEVGSYVLKTPDGQVADRGKYVVVWKKEGGGWKLHRDIWNSSQPAPTR